MNSLSTTSTFHQLIAGWENECVEFKEANDNFSTSDIGKYFSASAHESLAALDLSKQDEIRAQSLNEDWSAGICDGSTLADLDPAAIAKARETFIMKFNSRIPETEMRSWNDADFLVRIQKGHVLDESMLRSLRKRGLIEGRKPHLRITPNLAAQPEAKTDYLRHRAFDDDYYCKIILEYLAEFGSGKRADFERLLENKLSDALSLKQMERKIGNLLQFLRRQGKIETEGIKKAAVWKPASPPKPLKT
jgi:hypothetical protein